MNVENMTEEQIAKFPTYVAKWKDIGLATGKCDILESIRWAKEAYKIAAQDDATIHEPKYFFGPYNNPIEGAYAESIIDAVIAQFPEPQQAAIEMNRRVTEYFSNPDPNLSGLTISHQIFGSMEASWLAFYDFFGNELPNMEECAKLNPHIELAKVCGWWTPLEDACIFQHRPSEIHFDEQDRLHNETGPAIAYYDSELCNFYYVHGVRVTKKIIDRDFTAKDIDAETNAEVRRVMIDFYGQQRYIVDSDTKAIHSDEFGTLYRKDVADDVPIMMVEVTNSTKEPDGTYKKYWLRVDHEAYGGVKTARAAVASTWRNRDGSFIFSTPEDYVLAKET